MTTDKLVKKVHTICDGVAESALRARSFHVFQHADGSKTIQASQGSTAISMNLDPSQSRHLAILLLEGTAAQLSQGTA